ncbi:tannase/feruloyl esterase family alpha/beta hydrolase [Sphingosinicella sp. LHD-64]|uniref:tannase/feruloyl esterase family alpha/beta hydrolase n=1 Tax=Sphingosinicella sp. LHD-64 TaxID=3072139 RepID=UPI00280F606D|nr:tannase/feruloyl esterase family alpha/beta hydrolase [Sphingosinicella sp. LHD-64]MDQ8757119.1 tannase/feruloyl esterase family alpha/beta hydrolase [Sphingosinicella sp. LHD-64]
MAWHLSGAQAQPNACTALRRADIANVTIEAAEMMHLPSSGEACRVRGIARPVPGSRIGFELWLPREGWSGRYYQIGNGGFAGGIHSPSLQAEAMRGNAAASTDTGHRADAFDASWARGNPVALEDYGHRSIKATSDAAAALIQAYYGRPARWRYFAGCSNGGRQALVAAQRYPDDWDGILAGAPANPWTQQLLDFAHVQHRLHAVPGAYLPRAKLPAIQRAALAACPSGTTPNGIATNPPACRLDVDILLCRGGERDDCLTESQAETLRQIVAAGFQPTAAAYPGNWDSWILNSDPTAPSQLRFAIQGARYFFGSSSLIGASAPPDTAAWLDAGATGYDRFRARGGRIISYFGWADAVISPIRGLGYYRAVATDIGSVAAMRSFYRLFMVPGMEHCQGGPGSDSFGQSMVSPALQGDADHDVRLALECWVEAGQAPERLIAHRRRENGGAVTGRQFLRPVD